MEMWGWVGAPTAIFVYEKTLGMEDMCWGWRSRMLKWDWGHNICETTKSVSTIFYLMFLILREKWNFKLFEPMLVLLFYSVKSSVKWCLSQEGHKQICLFPTPGEMWKALYGENEVRGYDLKIHTLVKRSILVTQVKLPKLSALEFRAKLN